MFEKFTSGNARDFRQRYEGTFGFYCDNDNKKRVLAQLTAINDRLCSFVDARGIEYTLNSDTESNIGFEFIPPKSNWYNAEDGGTYIVMRVAARQFQRGITTKNVKIYKLHNEIGLRNASVNFKTLDQIYNKEVTPKDATAKFDAGEPLAISSQLALGAGLVFLFESHIGTYKKDGKSLSIRLNEPELWRTEITDALRPLGYTVEIK